MQHSITLSANSSLIINKSLASDIDEATKQEEENES